jgi:hypothetical protein
MVKVSLLLKKIKKNMSGKHFYILKVAFLESSLIIAKNEHESSVGIHTCDSSTGG